MKNFHRCFVLVLLVVLVWALPAQAILPTGWQTDSIASQRFGGTHLIGPDGLTYGFDASNGLVYRTDPSTGVALGPEIDPFTVKGSGLRPPPPPPPFIGPTVPAASGELRHWQALATDTQTCGYVQQAAFENPEPGVIFIRRIHFHVHADSWAVINSFLEQGWTPRSSLAFYVRYANGQETDRWSVFSPDYVSLTKGGILYFEYGCGGGGQGQFYMTIFYTLDP